MYVDAQTPILLQTARLHICDPKSLATPALVEARAIMDTGSQRTYVTIRIKQCLRLPISGIESLHIKTFGRDEGQDTMCETVELGLLLKNGETMKIQALVVPVICNPLTSQPISHTKETYDHLLDLELADSANEDDRLEVDALIGSDVYWSLVTGVVRRGSSGPMAIQTKVGWVLSGPTSGLATSINLSLCNTTHTLITVGTVCTIEPEQGLDEQLKRFWDLETLGIVDGELGVHEKFVQQIRFSGERYCVTLPWKDNYGHLPDNLQLCHRRLDGLIKRLRQNPALLERYDAVIREQLQRGIVELVNDEASNTIKERIHYLPHHAVVREDKATSKVRIVYDASARSTGPSLNDCLHTGPSFGQFIFDILLRFRVHAVALAGDIEKAFLMIKVDERDCDVLRFLWIQNSNAQPVEVITLRFTRVVFGVNCSPFLLNATIRHHMETYKSTDPEFVKKFLLSIYVDDVSFGSDGVQSTYDLYMKAKSRLKEGGFLLCKFITNSEELRHLIATNEQLSEPLTNDTLVKEEDQSYTKCTLGTTAKSDGQHKILGVQWDYIRDQFVFGIDEVACQMKKVEPTRRNALCAAKVGWDEPLKGELLKGWKSLCDALQSANAMTVPRCYHMITGTCPTARLIGFCDASSKAYAAVVYLRVEDDDDVSVTFVAAKTLVTPIKTISIPRLELLSALLLSRLVKNVEGALQSELRLNETICYTDSKVTLCWIQGKNHEWKQFVGNRVASIHTVVPPSNWYHCPGKENPADIPSRGMTPSELSQNTLWLSGPSWLQTLEGIAEGPGTNLVMPQECQLELKVTSVSNMLIATEDQGVNIAELINCERFSGTFRLLKTTVMVFRAVRNFLAKIGRTCQVIPNDRASEFDQARVIWLRQMQSQLQKCSKFSLWKQQFGLFVNELNLWRCGGRMGNSALAPVAKYPILLDKQHHLTRLIVMDAHKKVFHNGVRETLTELRVSYWLVHGRQLVRKLIFSCVTCRKHEGQPYRALPPPPLPEFRVTVSRPFEHTGVDFAGPLYVRRTENVKVWLCLYTCCTTRGVHLDLVENLDAATFIRSLKRFTSRRGIPVRIVSDNGSTFTAAAKVLKRMFTDPALEQHLLSCHMRWDFNLEKAPWWGGTFERLVKSTKRCLRKVIGTARLSYDELLTVVTEVEGVLNSRPLTYLSSEDVEEPLTPSHLMIGYCVMSLPDPPAVDFDDPTFNASPDNLRGRFKHLLIVTQRFWTRWRKEYLTELRESHRTLLARRKAADVVKNGEIVVIHDESLPRGQWRLGRIEQVIKGSDGHARGVRVRTQTKTGRPTVLQRPIQLIYPLEINGQPGSDDSRDIATTTAPDLLMDCAVDNSVTPGETRSRPQRAATVRAHGRIAEWMKD